MWTFPARTEVDVAGVQAGLFGGDGDGVDADPRR